MILIINALYYILLYRYINFFSRKYIYPVAMTLFLIIHIYSICYISSIVII